MLIISMTLRGGEGGGGRGGPALSVTMTLIFPKIVWTCPLTLFTSLTNYIIQWELATSKLFAVIK